MTTPIDEKAEPRYYRPHVENARLSDEEDHTVIGEDSTRNNSDQDHHVDPLDTTHLSVTNESNYLRPPSGVTSPSATREQASRLDDDLQMLQIERQISAAEEAKSNDGRSMHRSRSRHQEPVDEFDAATEPIHTQASMYKPPENPTTSFAKLIKKIHNSSWVIRYLTYIVPVVCIILIPLLLGALVFTDASVGGVKLVWFCIWLEIVWLTLWAGRVSCSPRVLLSPICADVHPRFSQSVFPGPLGLRQPCSRTTERNGVTWASSWSFREPYSFGGWPLSFPSTRP